MLHKMVQQFLGEVEWGDLDYLVIDLPPGTGDIQLSLCQTIPLTGAVIVSTPQDLALEVASKAIAMFKRLKAPILGIVENMSYFICPHCGQREEIFGYGGARAASETMGYPFLGEIPLDPTIRKRSDQRSTPNGRRRRDTPSVSHFATLPAQPLPRSALSTLMLLRSDYRGLREVWDTVSVRAKAYGFYSD